MSGFWKFTSNYASRVTKLIERSDFTLEDLLDENETIPELVASNARLVEYLREPEVLDALVEYVLHDGEIQDNEDEETNTTKTDQQIDAEHTEKGSDEDSKPNSIIENTHNYGKVTTTDEKTTAIVTDVSENKEGKSTATATTTTTEITTTTDTGTDTYTDTETETKETDAAKNTDSDSDSDSDTDSEDSSKGIDDHSFGDDMHMDDDFNEVDVEEEETLVEQHSRRAQVAAEILSSDVWSLTDSFMENVQLVEKLWSLLDKPAPLPILSATFFMKINEHLLDMKMDEMIQFILQDTHIVERFMRHIDTPPLMDFLLKVISTDKPDASTGIIDVLKEQGLIPALVSYLDHDIPSSIQSAAGDFLKAFITISANNAENTTIGPNELSRQLVSEKMVRLLVKMMLQGGTGLSNGVGIVIEIIRKNNSDYDAVPVVYITIDSHPPTPRDPVYLGTLVRIFAEAMPEFTKMLEKKVDKKLETPFGEIEPLGFERFKICELVAELIHCSNMALLNDEKGEEIVRERDEVREKLIDQQRVILNNTDADSSTSLDENEISREIGNLKLNSPEYKEYEDAHEENSQNDSVGYEGDSMADQTLNPEEDTNDQENQMIDNSFDMDETALMDDGSETEESLRRNPVVGDQLKIALYDNNVIVTILNMFFKFPWNNFLHNVVFDIVQQILNASMEIGYNKFLAIDLFGRGEITKLIINSHNRCIDYEAETGLRLGYMGHLTLIAEEVVKFNSPPLDNSSRSKIIADAVSADEWTQYVNETLVEIRNKYNAMLGSDEMSQEQELYVKEYLDDSEQTESGNVFQMVYGNDESEEQQTAVLDDGDLDTDQFSAYMAHQMSGDIPDKFGSSDEESEEEEQQQQQNREEGQHKGVIASSIGGHPYQHMSSGDLDTHNAFDEDDEFEYHEDEDGHTIRFTNDHDRDYDEDEDDYEDPNDDGQSYVKQNHPLYQADGSLNYSVRASELRISDSDSESDSDDNDVPGYENHLMKSK